MENEHVSLNTIGTTYLIEIPKKFRNKGWAESFGKGQDELRHLSENIKEINVDFSKCDWADPLPLLSLFIALSEIPDRISKIVYLPKPAYETPFSQKCLLAFLFKEGFIEICEKFNIRVFYQNSGIANEFSDKDKEQIISTYEKNLSYTDCTILPAKVIDLLKIVDGKENYVAEIEYEIENWLNAVQHRFSPNVASSLEKELLNKIDRFLKETIENVYEHAYPDDNKSGKKLVGCYIRFRKGLVNDSLDENSQKRLQMNIKEEYENCPRLDKSFVENSSGFFEIFIVDAGIGLSDSFPWDNERIPKYPFREAWRRTIGLGERSNKKAKNTEFGGLYTLSQLCQGSYLTARDSSDWIGDTLPVKNQNASYSLIQGPFQIKGLALIGRINSLTSKTTKGNWLNLNGVYDGPKNENPFIKAMQESMDIYFKYYNQPSSKMTNLVYYRDERFNNTQNSKYINYNFCLFLPPERLPKNRIFEIINKELLQGINDIKQRAIITADIPVGEANIYQYALCKARYSEEFLEKIDIIVLITRDLTVSILFKKEITAKNETYNTYDYNSELTKSFLLSTLETPFSPHQSFKHFVELIKTHDSLLFWSYINKKNQSYEFYLKQDICWYQDGIDIGLTGYLNFAKTLTDDFCKNIYELALEHTLCLSNESGCNYESIDLLTNKLAMQNNVLFYNSHKDEAQKILLGSVFVTGYTAKASQVGNKKSENDIIIHFFQNQNVNTHGKITNPVAQLLLWPREEWIKKLTIDNSTLSQCRRIGTSYVIAPYGWKYFPIPRYKLFDKDKNYFLKTQPTKEQIQNTERYEFKSVYECSPPDTYRYWQGKRGQVLNIGHIDYESHHDIFNIDFPFVINESFMMGDKLSQFLLSEFLYALGTNINGLKTDNQVLIDGVTKYLASKTTENKSILILYPFHYNSDCIVSKVKKHIKPEFHSKIIALFPVNKERADATYLISPLTIETLKEEINRTREQQKHIEVLLFDDATIEGKTRKEIKHTLFSLGVNSVRTLTLLERRRLPFSPSEPNYNRTFWRLDIPNLGSADTCPICNALQKLKDIKHNIASESVFSRIQDIEEKWGKSSPYENNNKQLLTPIPVNKILEKKFGIYIDEENNSIQYGGDENKIKIINSLGLSIYVSELHTMTSRDDVLDFLEKDELTNIEDYAKIEMLSTYLLLFKKELSNLALEKIIKELFRLCKDKSTDPYTAYALIALMNINAEKLNLLYDVCKDPGENDIKVINQDMEILCYSLGIDNSSPFSTSKNLKRLNKGSKNLKDTYKQLHSEIYNDYGIIHDTPLSLMSKEISISKENTSENIRKITNAKDSCDKILNLLELIPKDHYRFVENIEAQINQVKSDIVSYKQNSTKVDANNIKQQAMAILSNLQIINSLLFVSIGLQGSEFPLSDLLNTIISENKYNIKLSTKFQKLSSADLQIERWIIWDKMVNTKIRNLLHNADKGNKDVSGNNSPILIADPFDNLTETKAYAWISIEYDELNNNLSLIIYNKTDILAANVQEKTQLKPKYEKRHLKELDIKINYQDETINSERLLKTIITFPYL
jgi:hypothetical protein